MDIKGEKMLKIFKLITGILLIPIFFSVTGCSSKKMIPYEQTESYRTKVAYDTGLAQINMQNQIQSQQLMQMMNNDYRERQNEINRQNELYRQQQQASQPKQNTINCVSRNHGSGLPVYTTCN
jgi:hypothetical protein